MTASTSLPLATRRTGLLAASAAAIVLMTGMAASAQQGAAEPMAAITAASEPTEIERFCSNIADVARDRRYALQRQELETLQKDIDQRMKALEEKRAEYEELLKRREDFLSRIEDNVVKIYSTMKPDAAAERLAEVNVEVAAGILMKLEARKAGVILNEMNRKSAAELTRIMAAATRKEDPT